MGIHDMTEEDDILEARVGGWNEEDAKQLFMNLGEQGRKLYREHLESPLSLLYPFSRMAVFSIGLAQMFPAGSAFSGACVLPILSWGLETVVEKPLIYLCLDDYQIGSEGSRPWLAVTGGWVTCVKSGLFGTSLILFALGFL